MYHSSWPSWLWNPFASKHKTVPGASTKADLEYLKNMEGKDEDDALDVDTETGEEYDSE